jgi:energy-coupling factor transporter ATP-binding protein EcfA2
MSSSNAAAQRTCALIAGVEVFADPAPPFPTLTGATKSALKFYDWGKACGIPEDQIFLHLSPRTDETRGASWQDFVASKEALKEIDADTLVIYWAGHGDMKNRIRRLYTEDSGGLQQAVDFNSLLAALSSDEMPFETVFAFVDACATRSFHKFNQLRFPEDDSDLKALQYAWFATSPGEEASFYADGGAFSAVLLEWLEGVRLPVDPKRVDIALSARFRELELRLQRPVSLWINRGGNEWQAEADTRIAHQFSLSVKKEWDAQPHYRRSILLLNPTPGKTCEDPSFLAPELDALNRRFSELEETAAPDESSQAVDPLEFLSTYKHAVLLGEPGAGKSTLLRALHERLLKSEAKTLPDGLHDCIPLFLDLSRWDRRSKTLDDFLTFEAKRLGANEFAAEWPVLRNQRKFVLIFDGLDRMPDSPSINPGNQAKRGPDLDERINIIRRAADEFVCILSCRLREFDGRPVWRDLHLLPLTDDDIRKFAAMAHFTEARTTEFLEWLAHGTLLGRSLRELAGTPYWLLRLLAFFHKAKTARQKLTYEHLLLYALGDALENLRYRKRLSQDEVETLRRRLMNLAFHMTAAKLRRAEKEDVEDARGWLFRDDPIRWVREALQPKRELTSAGRTQAERTLALSREAGVLLANPDAIEFEHQLTQECFCLLYCMSVGVTEPLLENAAQRQFSEVWRLWAQQQPKVVDDVIAYLYPAWGDVTMAHAAEVLGMIGDKRATEALLSIARNRHADFVLRYAALYGLAQIADPRALPDLLEIIRNRDESGSVRARAAFAAGLIGDPAAVDTLIGVLKQADPDIVVEAAHALGRISDPRAIGPLVEVLREGDHETTLAASNALIWIGKPAVNAILPVIKTMAAGIGFQDALRALVALGGVDMKFLNLLARRHKHDPKTAEVISQTESEVLAIEARKTGKPPHRGK